MSPHCVGSLAGEGPGGGWAPAPRDEPSPGRPGASADAGRGHDTAGGREKGRAAAGLQEAG